MKAMVESAWARFKAGHITFGQYQAILRWAMDGNDMEELVKDLKW